MCGLAMPMSSSGWVGERVPRREDLLALAEDLGVGPVRDLGLLEAAAHRPTTSLLGGQEADSSLEVKAAALLGSVVNNHALVDGNKRLGALVCLDLNGVWIEAPDDDAYELVIAVASAAAHLDAVAAALVAWSRPQSAGNGCSLSWRMRLLTVCR